MKKLWILTALLGGVLVGCAGSANNVENARALLTALNTGDTDAAREYLCADEADDTIEGLATVGEDERQTFMFDNINCRAEGEDVQCTYSITQQMEDGTAETNTAEVVFNVEDGEICGFEEQVEE